jgi:hypothetical protein
MKYVECILIQRPVDRRTDTWLVKTKQPEGGGAGVVKTLGSIQFYPRWRAYAFYPLPQTLFEKDCLRDIADFCERATIAWRVTKRPLVQGTS